MIRLAAVGVVLAAAVVGLMVWLLAFAVPDTTADTRNADVARQVATSAGLPPGVVPGPRTRPFRY